SLNRIRRPSDYVLAQFQIRPVALGGEWKVFLHLVNPWSHRIVPGEEQVLTEGNLSVWYHTAFSIPTPYDRIENGLGAAGMEVLAIPGRTTPRIIDRAWSRIAELVRNPNDVFGRNFCFLLCPSGSKWLDVLHELIEAYGVIGDELPVVTAFPDNHIEHREDECQVSSRPDRVPFIRFRRRDSEARVQIDKLRLAVLCRFDQIHCVRRDERLQPVRARHDDVLGVQ